MLVAFSGLKGSGKDTAAQYLVDNYEFTRIAFADGVREMALVIDPKIPFKTMWGTDIVNLSQLVTQFGWEKIKRDIPEVRRLLQVIGTEAVRNLIGEDSWIKFLLNKFPDVADEDSKYVISDCRFPNEVDFVQSCSGTLVWIDRPDLVSDGHASESTEIRASANYIVHNDSTIEELYKDLELLMVMIGLDTVERRAEK
jgi:hypothetical protein